MVGLNRWSQSGQRRKCPDEGDQAALALLRAHVRKHFPGNSLSMEELVGYYAVVHAAQRLKGEHAIYPPPGCWWRVSFWQSDALAGTGG